MVRSLLAAGIAAFAAVASLSGTARAAPVEASRLFRREDPSNWPVGFESYGTYDSRYTSLGCDDKGNSNPSFFNDCCNPMLAEQVLPGTCGAGGSNNNDNNHSNSDSNSNDDDDDYSAPAPSPTSSLPPPPAYSAPAPTPSQPPANGDSGSYGGSAYGQTYTGGDATYFYQNGVAGACGTVHSDNDPIVALDFRRYGPTNVQSQYCGQKVLITNKENGKTIVATVADACPTCTNENCLDLSVGAFTSIADMAQGVVPITYQFIN